MAGKKITFTEDRVKELKFVPCKAGYTLYWDAKQSGLAVRVTKAGARTYVFERRLKDGRTCRVNIGAVADWKLSAPRERTKTPDEDSGRARERTKTPDEDSGGARERARELSVLVDRGRDPRIEAAAEVARRAAVRTEAQRKDLVFAGVWQAYIDASKDTWGARHLANHRALAHEGGRPKKKRGGKGLTMAGPLAAFLPLKLSELTAERIAAWLAVETRTRPTSAAQAFRALKTFVKWTQETSDYKGIIPADACTASTVRKRVPKPKDTNDDDGDCLEAQDLSAWFREVRALSNPVISAFLQGLLLLGPRRGELTGLRWSDVAFDRGGSLVLRDKAKQKGLTPKAKLEGKGTRTIPLPPYMASLLKALPHRNEWVFSSEESGTGRLVEPTKAHRGALTAAGIPAISLHGLRRSFCTLAECEVEIPSGIVAKLQGHKPSALVEKHYKRRTLGQLRTYHEKYEAWILGEAGVPFTRPGEKAKLGVVGDDGTVQPAA